MTQPTPTPRDGEMPFNYGVRKDGSIWAEYGTIDGEWHCAGDMPWPLWAHADLKRRLDEQAAPVAQRVAEACKPLERELAEVRIKCNSNADMLDACYCEREESKRDLQLCQTLLASERQAKVERGDMMIAAESARDSLAALVVKMKEALTDTQEIIDIVKDFEVGEAEGPCAANRAHAIGLIVESALISVPADLADCVVIPKNRLPSLEHLKHFKNNTIERTSDAKIGTPYADELVAKMPKAATAEGHTCFNVDDALDIACAKVDETRTANAALEAENKLLRANLRRALDAINAGFGKAQRAHIIAEGEAALSHEGKEGG